MRRSMVLAAAAAFMFVAAPVHAGPYGDKLSRCLVASATPQDRADLMLWIFAAMSRNEAAAPYVNFSEAQRDDISRRAATIMQRPITDHCRKESIAAFQNEPTSFETAFEALGELAGEELIRGPGVADELDRMVGFIAQDSLEQLGEEAAGGSGTRRSGKGPV